MYPINKDLGCIRIEVMVGLDAIDNIYTTSIIYKKGEYHIITVYTNQKKWKFQKHSGFSFWG